MITTDSRPIGRNQSARAVFLYCLVLAGCATTTETPPSSENLIEGTSQATKELPNFSDSSTFPYGETLEKQLTWTFVQAQRLVENKTETDLSHVTIRIAEEEEIQKAVSQVTKKLVFEQFDKQDYAEFFLKKIITDQQGTYAALYVDGKRSVLVNRSLMRAYINTLGNESDRYPALLALLVHELVHAADDVNYGIHKDGSLSFKASFTQSATFEGHAQFVTRQICTEHDCLSGMQALENFMFETTQLPDPVAQSAQAISRNVLEYSYIEGERFLTELSQRENGQELIARVLNNPPADPVQILVPETYPDLTREKINAQLYDTLNDFDHSWSKSPWKLVETSPIKGIDVRNDPNRRVAAVEGFTELIVAMTGAQLYNQNELNIAPIDIMLIKAESRSTAKLFAESFVNRFANSIATTANAGVDIERFENIGPHGYAIYVVSGEKLNDKPQRNATAVGLLDDYVVQISATVNLGETLLESYVNGVMSGVSTLTR